MRYSIEQLLKFFYSIYNNIDINSINSTKYRTIKEFFKDLDISDVENELKKIYTYYAKYSNDIHDKTTTDNIDSFRYLKNIIVSDNLFVASIIKDLNDIEKIYNKLMNIIFNVKYDDLTVSERLSMETTLRKKMYKIITEGLQS